MHPPGPVPVSLASFSDSVVPPVGGLPAPFTWAWAVPHEAYIRCIETGRKRHDARACQRQPRPERRSAAHDPGAIPSTRTRRSAKRQPSASRR